MKLLQCVFFSFFNFLNFSAKFEIIYPDGTTENKELRVYGYENIDKVLNELKIYNYTAFINGKKIFYFDFENNKNYKLELKKNEEYRFTFIDPNIDEFKEGKYFEINGYKLTIDEAIIKILYDIEEGKLLKNYNLKLNDSILYPSQKYLKFFGGKFIEKNGDKEIDVLDKNEILKNNVDYEITFPIADSNSFRFAIEKKGYEDCISFICYIPKNKKIEDAVKFFVYCFNIKKEDVNSIYYDEGSFSKDVTIVLNENCSKNIDPSKVRNYYLNINVNGNVDVKDYSEIKNLNFEKKNGCRNKMENCVRCCCSKSCGGQNKMKLKEIFND